MNVNLGVLPYDTMPASERAIWDMLSEFAEAMRKVVSPTHLEKGQTLLEQFYDIMHFRGYISRGVNHIGQDHIAFRKDDFNLDLDLKDGTRTYNMFDVFAAYLKVREQHGAIDLQPKRYDVTLADWKADVKFFAEQKPTEELIVDREISPYAMVDDLDTLTPEQRRTHDFAETVQEEINRLRREDEQGPVDLDELAAANAQRRQELDAAGQAIDDQIGVVGAAAGRVRAAADDSAPIVNPEARYAHYRDSVEFSPEEEETVQRIAKKWSPKGGSRINWGEGYREPYKEDLSYVTPRPWLSGKWAAIGSFATTALLTSVSRMAIVAGATSIGVAALPAGIAAGIAIGAARNYYKNREEILAEAEMASDPADRRRIIWAGVRKSFSPVQIGMTVAGGVGGAFLADYVSNLPPERVAQAMTLVKEHTGNLMTMASNAGQSLANVASSVGSVFSGWFKSAAEEAPATTLRETVVQPAEIKLQDRLMTPDLAVAAIDRPLTLPGVVAINPVDQIFESFRVRPMTEFATRWSGISPYSDAIPVLGEGAIIDPNAAMIPRSVISETFRSVAPIDHVTAFAEPAAEIPAVEPVVPPTRTHTVGRGDNSLWKIVQNTYGVRGDATVRAMERVIALNPDLLANPNRLSLGQQVIMPTSLDTEGPSAECNWRAVRRGRRNACTLD